MGIEKLMFYRICRLLTLNIQLIFVFDGPGRPWKRNKRGQGKIDYEKRRLLQEVLRCFDIPYHEAPGEAEAECARLQILGLVDAVWSQDSDCLMFGCTLWIHDDRVAKEKGNNDRSKENTKKNSKSVRVVKAPQMAEKLGLDREGLVLFAMLVGGDYKVSGLAGCGSATALHAVKAGLGKTLCQCQNQRDCSAWSTQLADFIGTRARSKYIHIPGDFPDYKILQKYYRPKVSSDETLLSISRLNLSHDRGIKEVKLLEVTSSRFNIWGRKYMDWVGPVLLTRHLARRGPVLPREVVHNIKLTKRRAKKTDDQPATRCLERKLTFSPFGVTSLQRADFEGDRLGYWNGDMTNLFDPGYRVDCEIPEYWLQKTLPLDVLGPPPPEPKRRTQKRKQQTDGDAQDLGTTASTKRKRKQTDNDQVTGQVPSRASSSKLPVTVRDPQASVTPIKRRKQPTRTGETLLIELSDSEDEDTLRLPSKVHSRKLTSTRSAASEIVDLGSPEPSEDDEHLSIHQQEDTDTPSRAPFHRDGLLIHMIEREERDLQLALRMSLQGQQEAMSPSRSHLVPNRVHARKHSPGVANRPVFSKAPISIPAISPRKAFSHHLDDLTSDPTRTVTSATPVKSTDWSYSSPAVAVSTTPGSTPNAANMTTSKDDVPNTSASESTKLKDIRVARLRHFAPSIPTSNVNETFTTSPSSRITPSKVVKPTVRVPAGVDCIDLTDD
ncbi:hypothetical protein N0V83_010473 [Neocucurbitaria cava]|uniref:XPG-I domain-containing protein n=1 Tax=Neocucurbitaria cava TaxID=798079 RepID=A0A9W8XZP2_9PLEO|nr:hypothetical protein N0V83_010473 [Neocucurbitaria cava]